MNDSPAPDPHSPTTWTSRRLPFAARCVVETEFRSWETIRSLRSACPEPSVCPGPRSASKASTAASTDAPRGPTPARSTPVSPFLITPSRALRTLDTTTDPGAAPVAVLRSGSSTSERCWTEEPTVCSAAEQMSGASVRSLHLRGEDVGDQSYWAWEWSDGRGSVAFATVDRGELRRAVDALTEALPGLVGAETTADRAELEVLLRTAELAPGLRALAEDALASTDAARTDRLRELLMVHRCTAGPLTDPARERDLVAGLASLLVQRTLVAALRQAVAELGPDRVELRVLPSASCAQVPWEILPTGGEADERLLDLARVVTMAPILVRDGDDRRPHPAWAERRTAPPLYIVDPHVGPEHGIGSVLLADEDQAGSRESQQGRWRNRIARHRVDGTLIGDVGEPGFDRNVLSRRLLETQPSRLFYFGHVSSADGKAASSGLVLADSFENYGFGPRTGAHGARRDFTAQDAFVGTLGRSLRLARLADGSGGDAARARRSSFGRGPRHPDVVVAPDGTIRELAGERIWPMPPRVALIACRSGGDLGHPEPFGLVTAFLELGAELVTATRWALFTDAVARHGYGLAATPLGDLAEAVDDVQQSTDPLQALADWQRTRLAAWRSDPGVATSPLTWAAVTNIEAPDRTVREG